MFKNIWIRLGAALISTLVSFLLVHFMHVNESTFIADSLVIIVGATFATYAIVHPLLEEYLITKKPLSSNVGPITNLAVGATKSDSAPASKS
jgi:hypothetical protein